MPTDHGNAKTKIIVPLQHYRRTHGISLANVTVVVGPVRDISTAMIPTSK